MSEAARLQVNKIVAQEIAADRAKNYEKLKKLRNQLLEVENEEMALIMQGQCDHEWVPHGEGGRYGGYDSDQCKHCGRIYEF